MAKMDWRRGKAYKGKNTQLEREEVEQKRKNVWYDPAENARPAAVRRVSIKEYYADKNTAPKD